MTAVGLIDNLRQRGIILALTAKGIKVSPASALTADELAELRSHRDELAQLLREEAEGYPAPSTSGAGAIEPTGTIPAAQVSSPVQPSHDGIQPVPRPVSNPAPKASGGVFNPPIRKPTHPPFACLAGMEIGDLTPPEHFELIGGSAALRPLDDHAAFRLWFTAGLYRRDGPEGRWAWEYAYFWHLFTTGDMRHDDRPQRKTHVELLRAVQ